MGEGFVWLEWLLTQPVVLLSVGGTAGTGARYFLTTWIGDPACTHTFPVATFTINVSGSFILGVAAGIIGRCLPPEYGYLLLLIGTGFCGGYTTFSTFEYETFQLVRSGSWLMAMAYVLSSVLAGFLGVLAAVTLVDALPSRARAVAEFARIPLCSGGILANSATAEREPQ